MKLNGRFFVVMGLVLVSGLGLALVRNGNNPENRPASAIQDYQLDPPGLADLEIGDVEPGVPVLCYHYFRSSFDAGYLLKVLGSVFFGMPALGAREFWTTPVSQFESHLKYFQETNIKIMTLDEVADLYQSGNPIPANAVVLTIDDADISVYKQAWPLLKKYNARAHLFVPTAMVGIPWSSLDVCSWEQLTEMSDSGNILVGSHSRSLHYKIATSDKPEPVFLHPASVSREIIDENLELVSQLENEMGETSGLELASAALVGEQGSVAADILASRMEILHHTGKEPTWLAWPYGFADGSLDSLSHLMGFRGTVSLKPDTYSPDDGTQVGRFALTAKSTLDRIKMVFPNHSN